MWLFLAITDLKILHVSVDIICRDLSVNDQQMKDLKQEFESTQYFSVSDVFLVQVW